MLSSGASNISLPVSSTLIFDARGACIGVRATDGAVIYASKIILCTGAGTAKLLVDSAPSRPELWVQDRLVAAGVCTAAVKLTEAQMQKFTDVPVLVHRVGDVLGIDHSLPSIASTHPSLEVPTVLLSFRGNDATHP